jgi:hypothetical protein
MTYQAQRASPEVVAHTDRWAVCCLEFTFSCYLQAEGCTEDTNQCPATLSAYAAAFDERLNMHGLFVRRCSPAVINVDVDVTGIT